MQPPSGGCVLKQELSKKLDGELKQPPSGGCVLKRLTKSLQWKNNMAATFGWLCVETILHITVIVLTMQPPSGGCVLKPQ